MTNAPVPPMSSGITPPTGPPGQLRSPVTVILLSIVTLGIYHLFWYFRVFEDLKLRTGEGVGGAIGLLLGLCLGIVNLFLLPAEIGNMYASEGLEKPVTGLTGFWNFIPLIGWIIWLVKVQDAMNDRWEALGGTHV